VSSPITVDVLGPPDHDRWARLVAAAPTGGPYNLPAYLETLAAITGDTFVVLGARRGEELVGGLAVLERRSPLGPFVAPRLLLFYNGFVLRNLETRYPSERAARQAEVVAALAEALVARGYGRVDLSTPAPFGDARPLLAAGWRVTPSYTYVVPLVDLESQWKRVEQNQRRLVERGREQGLELVVDEDFDSFYDLHRQTAERKGAPLYLPAAAFRRYYEELHAKGLCRLYHARLPSGRVGASQLVLLGHRVTHTVSAAAEPELQSTGANPFLRWSAFEHLAADGYEANDLTDAMLPSVARFKAQLGGDLVQFLVASRPLSPAFRLQTAGRALLKRLRRPAGEPA